MHRSWPFHLSFCNAPAIMHSTTPLRVPVLTFLSRSPSASRQSLRLLEKLTSVQPLDDDSSSSSTPRRDGLDESAFSSALLKNYSFHSVASLCPKSQAVIHLLSIAEGQEQESNSETNGATSGNFLSLLSVTDDGSSYDEADKSLQHSRQYLSKHLKGGGGMLLGAQLAMRTWTDDKYPVEAHHLLEGALPMLDLSCVSQYENKDSESSSKQRHESTLKPRVSGIRELVIPAFDSTIQSQLSSCAAMSRPKVGLYRWPGNDSGNGIIIRPLPSATEDRELSPPSIVFQCDNLESCVEALKGHEATDNTNTALAKVGFSGCGTGGQYMIRNALLDGLDIRICEATELSSSFAEAQEALLAASLDELQSVNVMNEGCDDGRNAKNDSGKSQEGGSDAMNGLGDCWVEFRANVKKPAGFFGRKGGSIAGGSRRKKLEIAKAPNIPYE